MSPAQLPPPGVSEEVWFKNRLQQYTQRASIGLPMYQTLSEGSPQAPSFRAQVWVDGTCFTSSSSFSTKKMAEQDAAKHALIGIQEKVKSEGSSFILQDTFFCKSIIHEYAVKSNLTPPTYLTNQSEAMLPIFVSSLVINGVTYIGDAGRNKREAEQLAARSAILSILDSESSTTMSEIVKSKSRFYEVLKKVKDIYSAGGTVPTAMNSLKFTEDSYYVQAGSVPAGMDALEATLSVHKKKEVLDCGGTATDSLAANPQSNLPTQLPTQIELPESSLGQPSSNNTKVVVPPLHVFKKPKLATSSEAIASTTLAPPIEFVPPAMGQAITCSTYGKKRSRRNKKVKKTQHESPLSIIVIPQSHSQLPPCSVAQ